MFRFKERRYNNTSFQKAHTRAKQGITFTMKPIQTTQKKTNKKADQCLLLAVVPKQSNARES